MVMPHQEAKESDAGPTDPRALESTDCAAVQESPYFHSFPSIIIASIWFHSSTLDHGSLL